MIEAVILAGGQGSRLCTRVRDVPKPMADIAGKPFLWWLMTRLAQQGAGRVILAVGYKSETIQDYFGEVFDGIEILYSTEREPLGTGGAMKLALQRAREPHVIVLNGDTYVDTDLQELMNRLRTRAADIAIAVAHVDDVARYGAISIDEESGTLTRFDEKQASAGGYINAGIYCLRRDIFATYSSPTTFSFERDFLPKYLSLLRPIAVKGVKAFIDIGLPDDYALAQDLIPALAAAR
jgi:D-glycero-alpha-D-manno-heptose 1-phosphate guanylyltransferase